MRIIHAAAGTRRGLPDCWGNLIFGLLLTPDKLRTRKLGKSTSPVTAVVSMGRRNTKLEPPGIENKSQNRSLELEQQDRCPG